MPRRKKMYFDPRPERFDRFEDGSVGLPNGKVVDAETRAVRAPIKVKVEPRVNRRAR